MAVNWEVWEGIAKMENAPGDIDEHGIFRKLVEIRKNLQSLEMLTLFFAGNLAQIGEDMSLEFRFLKQ